MHLEYSNPNLGITAKHGSLFITTADLEVLEIKELTLDKLAKIYPRWQHLTQLMQGQLPTLYMGNSKVRTQIQKLLKEFGLNYRKLTFNQIEVLLFFEISGDKVEPSLLWRFHNVYPRSLDVPSDDSGIDYDKHINLDQFETAILYLYQDGKEHLIYEWPLSRIMRLMMSKAFINWAADKENLAKLKEQQNLKYMMDNPIDPQELAKKLQGKVGKFSKAKRE